MSVATEGQTPSAGDAPDRILTLYEEVSWGCDPDDEPLVRAAVRQWIEDRRDSLVHVTTIDGAALTVRASAIISWRVSTRATRLEHYRIDAALEREGRQSKPTWE